MNIKKLTLYSVYGYNVVMDKVDLFNVQKQLKKLPEEIRVRLQRWIKTVEEFGLTEARKVKGYHDEPLKGQRAGERSIRLGLKWRAIYIQSKTGEINIIFLQEITPHDYRKK